jgi:hypothetical protein
LKILSLLLFFIFPLLAESLPELGNSFSHKIQKELLLSLEQNTTVLIPHTNNTYIIKKGWNSFISSKDGIDIIKTFKDLPSVALVVTYDFKSKYWAGFTLEQSVLKEIKEMLLLRSLEANQQFFVLSLEDMKLKVSIQKLSPTCLKIQKNPSFLELEDSGLTTSSSQNIKRNISLTSRYHSHQYRGYYDDTRVKLFYPKLSALNSKKTLHYGPAEPTIFLDYAKEYENTSFYIYDYMMHTCYKGTFPSKRMPPFPTLQILE